MQSENIQFHRSIGGAHAILQSFKISNNAETCRKTSFVNEAIPEAAVEEFGGIANGPFFRGIGEDQIAEADSCELWEEALCERPP